MTLTLRDENGNLITSNQQAFLDADLGTLSTVSGTDFMNGSASLTVNFSGGRTTLFFIAGDVPGPGSVSGFSGNSDLTSETITVRDAPSALTLSASPATVNSGATDNEVVLTALVTDSDGNRISNEIVTFNVLDSDGNPISFACSESPCAIPTGQDGNAEVTVTINGSTLPDGRPLTATASVRGGAVENTATITVQ